jgi:hypothetical protein
VRWLLATVLGVMIFGLALAIAPGLARQGFSWLIYADAERLSGFGTDAVAYIALMHAVLGCTMFGWGIALLGVVRGLFAHGNPAGWTILAGSVAAWFIPDTAFSLWSGVWQNAGLNLVFVLLFVLPLVATYRNFRPSRTTGGRG